MKKVILNQISKAVAGGSNYFYLPLNLVEGKGGDSHYETTVDLSKLFEVDSNNVPVIKEVVVYNEKSGRNAHLLYLGGKGKNHYYCSLEDTTIVLEINGNIVSLDDITITQNTDETNDNSDPKDDNPGGK